MPQFVKGSIKLLIILAFIIYFLYLVIVRMPATLVTANLVKAMPHLQLAVVSGSVWQGQAGDAAINIQGQPIRLGVLRWHFQPMKLLALKACVDLESEVFNGNVCKTITGVNQFHKFQAELPARLANQLTGEAQFSGLASINILRAEITDKGYVKSLSGNLSWRGARVNVQNMWFTLGDYAADIVAAEGGNVKASLFDLAGPFGVKLEALVGVNITPTAQGTILPKEDAQEAIKDVLGLFAVPQEDGAFAVKYPL